MKKLLLSLISATALCVSATNVPTLTEHIGIQKNDIRSVEFPVEQRNCMPTKIAKVESTNTMELSFADDPYSAVGFNNAKNGNKVAMAFEMTPEMTTAYAGSVITHINFWTGVNTTSSKNEIPEVTVFLSDGDHTTAFYTQTYQVGETRFSHYSVQLDQPYTIEAGKDLYIGCYSLLTKSDDYTVVVDNLPRKSPVGGWVSITGGADAPFSWDNLYASYGYVCVSATLQGNNFPQNYVQLDAIDAPLNVETGKNFDVEVTLTNRGQNPVESVEMEYTIGNGQPATTTIKPAIESTKSKTSKISISTPSNGSYNIKMRVTKVNGVDVSSQNNEKNTAVLVFGENDGFAPNIVIEEFTGTWCGFCPIGIYTMEAIREKYADGTFIPVAIHSGDAMESDSYSDVIRYFCSGSYPSAIINRNPSIKNTNDGLYPYPPSDMDKFYTELRASKVPVEVTLSCNFTDDSKKAITFEGYTKFCFDFTNPNYILSFGITEDNVGPYSQNNNFAGQQIDLGGWEDQGRVVRTTFNDVARHYESIEGIEGSIPASVTAMQENPYSYTMTLPAGVKPDNLNGIVYLTETTTGQIINAAMVKAGNFNTNGVDDILTDTDTNAPVEYFNLQGIKVENPSNGIFIRRQGNKVEKVAFN